MDLIELIRLLDESTKQSENAQILDKVNHLVEISNIHTQSMFLQWIVLITVIFCVVVLIALLCQDLYKQKKRIKNLEDKIYHTQWLVDKKIA